MSLVKRNKENRPPLNPHSKCVVAVTGGIGSGKSSILKHLKKLGFDCYDLDKLSKKLMLRNGEAFAEISKIFPQAVIKSGISTPKLRKLAFTDKTVFPKLEKILHPLLRTYQQKLIDKSTKSLAFEVPLLFENEREDYYDYVICALSPLKIQKSRVLERKGMTNAKLDAILAKQTDNTTRKNRADFVIDTSLNHSKALAQIRKILHVADRKRNSIRHRDDWSIHKKR